MYIQKLELSNFRNYELLSLQPSDGVNVLYGDNAQGKTNILESIYMCSTAKSHRTNKDNELIRFGSQEAHVKLLFQKEQSDYRIDLHLKANKPKGIAINGMPIHKVSELFGVLDVVLFSPEDLGLIKKGPSERRKFIDLQLCQLNNIYTNELLRYNKVLAQRNKLLKTIDFRPDLADTLEIWDMQLVQYGRKLIQERQQFVNRLNEIASEIHYDLTAHKEQLQISYEPNVSEDNFEDSLKKNRERELRQHISLVGPHRDDIAFRINQVDIRKYGSQGQQRTTALSMKLAHIHFIKILKNDSPVLLLDDVLSELDKERQCQLFQYTSEIQTVITCTGSDAFISESFPVNQLFYVLNGTVTNVPVNRLSK